VKAFLAICSLTLSSYGAVVGSADLGPLTNYYHDCPASRGPQAAHLRNVISSALRGDEAAMRSVIMHEGIFSTGDNEGYGEAPQGLLLTLGDDRYAAFVTRQSHDVRQMALAVYPEQIHGFARRFPKTARLYHERFRRQPRTSNQSLQPTALWRCASMSILISVFSTVAQPRSRSGG